MQRSLLTVLQTLSLDAQVILASHSPHIVSAAPLRTVLRLHPPGFDDTNQVHRAADDYERHGALDDLGVGPSDYLLSDFFLVVEGPTDVQQLQTLFPAEMGRCTPFVAGDAGQVEAFARTTATGAGGFPVPLLCVRDRDFLSGEEVEALIAESPSLFVWNGRAVENELLHPPLLQAVLERANAGSTETGVKSALGTLAEAQRQEVLARLIEAELERRYPVVRPEGSSDAVQKVRRGTAGVREAFAKRTAAHGRVTRSVALALDARWGAEKLALVQGKAVLAAFAADHTPFDGWRSLVRAIAPVLEERPELVPPGLARFKSRLEKLLA